MTQSQPIKSVTDNNYDPVCFNIFGSFFQLGQRTTMTIEINLIVKDADGNPTNERRTAVFDNGDELSSFWSKYQGRPKRKKKQKVKKEHLPKAAEADKLLKQVGEYAEQQQDARREETK